MCCSGFERDERVCDGASSLCINVSTVCSRVGSYKTFGTHVVVEMSFDITFDHSAQCADEIVDLARALIQD